jgi:hypothetical protein
MSRRRPPAAARRRSSPPRRSTSCGYSFGSSLSELRGAPVQHLPSRPIQRHPPPLRRTGDLAVVATPKARSRRNSQRPSARRTTPGRRSIVERTRRTRPAQRLRERPAHVIASPGARGPDTLRSGPARTACRPPRADPRRRPAGVSGCFATGGSPRGRTSGRPRPSAQDRKPGVQPPRPYNPKSRRFPRRPRLNPENAS